MIPVILAVHIDQGKWVDVPISPDTTCSDVIECCREPSDEICSLVHSSGFKEHVIPEDTFMMGLLHRHNYHWPSVTFQLRYSGRADAQNKAGGPRPFSPTECRAWNQKLPDSNDLSLSDLRQMAARQQHQIEAHQQLLVAKEQRLKFLKQQEMRHHQQQAAVGSQHEGERLRQLRERVELQELKLRRLRVLRGQVEQHKSNNCNLGAELESIRALFNEKEKELSLAVAKVEELTRQLEDVRRGDISGLKPSPVALEFQKLKRELLYRSRLNEEQNARIAQQRETLALRQSEISHLDQRIAQLQQRLQRKRIVNQQLSSQLASRNRARSSNIAAVEPLKRDVVQAEPLKRDGVQVEQLKREAVQPGEFGPNKNDPKYRTLPYNTKFPLSGNGSEKTVNGSIEESNKLNGPPPYPEPPSVHSPTLKSPPTRALSPRSFIGSGSGSTSMIPRSPYQRIPTTSAIALSSSSSNTTITSSPPKSTTVGSSRPRPPQAILPPTVLTPGIPRTIPQTPARQYSAPSYSIANSRSKLSNGSSEPPKPLVPPKPGIPQATPVLPPRHFQGKTDSVVDPSVMLKGDLRNSEERRPPPPQHPVMNHHHHHRHQSSTYNHHHLRSSDMSDSSTNSTGDSESRSSPPHRDVHVSLNRRIGMPPAHYFPETQPPPSDLNCSEAGKRRRHVQEEEPPLIVLDTTSSESEMHSPKSGLPSEKTKDQDFLSPPQSPPSDSIPSTDSSPQVSSLSPDSTDRSSSDAEQLSDRGVVRRVKKGNLKTKGSGKNGRRVSFDPLALLLDAALEGELDLVKKTAQEVPNPSAANDEGITALHNAICAGHLEIVKFLVEFGCDVNAEDSDGWTPLHCAASCNNLSMVKYLVERGACIFATTHSDHETAAEKCEEDEEGFDGTSEYLYSMQEKLGILNNGVVYAVYDYESQKTDELAFRDGEQLTVLRKGDEVEREWWWSRHKDREGYVPRNLLGLHPRVTTQKESQ